MEEQGKFVATLRTALRSEASSDEHADQFWALRRGGGNFGIVTPIVFRAHPVNMPSPASCPDRIRA